jgi:phage gp36-like protein
VNGKIKTSERGFFSSKYGMTELTDGKIFSCMEETIILKKWIVNTKSSNFDMDYFTQLDLKNKFVYYTSYLDIYQRGQEKDIAWLIDDINRYKNIAQRNGKQFIFVVDAKNEAPTYRYNLNLPLDKISNKAGILVKDIIIFSGAYGELGDDVKHCYTPNIAFVKKIANGTMFNTLPNYHFVSLARLARHHRITATIEILDRGLEPYGNMSLGSGYYNNPNENDLLKNLIPVRYSDKFPMYLDGIIAENTSMRQYDSRDDKIITAFVNFVMETSYENNVSPHTWNVPFITEKSMKPFAYGQIPIFLNCANSLQKIRDFGFDLFDDIIDHGYDNEPDPMTRIKLCVDQLEKICRWSLADCRKFKQDNMQRFESNRKVLDKLLLNCSKITIENLQKTLDSYDL